MKNFQEGRNNQYGAFLRLFVVTIFVLSLGCLVQMGTTGCSGGSSEKTSTETSAAPAEEEETYGYEDPYEDNLEDAEETGGESVITDILCETAEDCPVKHICVLVPIPGGESDFRCVNCVTPPNYPDQFAMHCKSDVQCSVLCASGEGICRFSNYCVCQCEY